MDKILNVPFQQQQNGVWCWAAVASMVSGWYAARSGNQGLSQCQVASATLGPVLGLTSCCSSSSVDPACVRLWDPDKALAAVGHFAGIGGQGNLATVINQIEAFQPLGALMKFWNGIFHVVLVTGYSDSQQLIVVCDPAASQAFSVPVNVFFSNYNNAGYWGGWYFTA